MPLSDTASSAPSMRRIHDEDVRADPYPFYRRLREEAPVLWDPEREEWVLSRHADVVAALRHPSISVAHVPTGPFLSASARQAAKTMSRLLLFLDAPDHTRLRRLVSKTFTPRMVENLRPTVTAHVDALLDAAEPNGGMDLIEDFAFPLPINVIAQMLGVPAEDHERMRDWSLAFRYLVDDSAMMRAAGVGPVMTAVNEFMEYLTDLVAERRRDPRQDLISDLIAVEEQGDRLTMDELLTNVLLLLAAGHGTTVHLMGNGTLALLRNPDQWRLLCEDPSIVPNAVQELLRYDGPVQITERLAAADLTIGGQLITAGQKVRPLIGAANRDPDVFEEPDRLDLMRGAAQQVAFGHGVHACLGMALARLEGEVAFARLAERFPGLRQPEGGVLEWDDTVNFRGLRRLDVSWG